MNAIDFSPLFRSTVGFDRVMSLLEHAASTGDGSGFPPYDILKSGEDAYRITMAVAGFSSDDLSIETRENVLHVEGRRAGDEEEATVLHRGIAGRSFRRRFQLAEFVKVENASLENGLLHIDLIREVPEEMRPRKIEISASNGASSSTPLKKIEQEKAAA